MWDEIYMRVQWTVPFISYGTVGYDGQVGCDTYSVKLDDSPISRSTVGYVGLRVQWMVTHIPHGTVEWDTRGNVVDSPTYPT